MKYKFLIRNNETGEEVLYDEDYDWLDGDYYKGEHRMLFQWQENNNECDCNRANFFQRAKGLDDIDVECNCGDINRKYSVPYCIDEFGNKITIDGEENI